MAQSPTTEKEYNYMNNGYREDVLLGKDIKAGYFTKKLAGFPFATSNGLKRAINFEGFYREKDSSCAGFIMTVPDLDGSDFTDYIGLSNSFYKPGEQTFGSDKYNSMIDDMPVREAKLLLKAMSWAFRHLADIKKP